MDQLTDEEQAAQIKRFWHESGRYILIAVLIGLAIGYAWRWYQGYLQQQRQLASALYIQLFAGKDSQAHFAERLAQLKKDHAKSPYAQLSAMIDAKMKIDQGNTQAAVAEYRWVIQQKQPEALHDIAVLRLARLMVHDKKPEQALVLLKQVKDENFDVYQSLIKARALQAMGKPKLALQSRLAAMSGMQRLGMTPMPWLLM